MERLLTLTATILLSCSAFGAGTNPAPVPTPNPDDITFTANLNISKCTDSGSDFEMCGSMTMQPNVVVLTLKPDGNNFYKGNYVLLEEMDGQRFIGIISVTRYDAVLHDGSRRPHYYMTAEILDVGRTTAKMSTDFSDIAKIPSATLYGGGRRIASVEYRALLSISAVCDPNPTSPSCTNNIAPSSTAHWEAQQGRLL